MSSQTTPSIAFILSLIGGVLIVLGGFVSAFWALSGTPWFDGMMGPWMMGGHYWMTGGYGYPYGLMLGFSVASLVAGMLVIIGAIMINARPEEHMAWGIIVLVFSIVSLVGMGGFFIGALLGVAGGALALSFRPRPKA